MDNKKRTQFLPMKMTLILIVLIPMLVSTVSISIILASTSTKELKESTNRSLVAIIDEIGTAFDYTTDNSECVMRSFIESPIVKEYLKNPDDAELAAKAQEYTVNYFGTLDGWEGIYIADWDSKVLTHPAAPVIGRVMREGDRLTELQNEMLASDGVYNVGIITSPASGKLVTSLYAPVYDENGKPIGYVGGGTFVNDVASHYSDVSALNLDSAYIYFVDKEGTMLFHPDEEKIGKPVENAAVKGLVARIAAGEHPEPDYIVYEYKGASKYAAYYVGADEAYIAVLTADEADVLSEINKVIILAVIIVVVCLVIFGAVSLIISRKIATPLSKVAKSIEQLGTGNVTVECDAKSSIDETSRVINAFGSLKEALQSSMSNVKEAANALNGAIIGVDSKTANNVESISQINTAIDEVAETSQVVAASAQEMANKASDLGENIDQLNENVSILSEASSVIKNANNEATACMKSVYAGANESVEAMRSITEKISETNAAVIEINAAVQAIESIASQTNLLSLNASIEAARAGESGRGFAVVADEIRGLADSSAQSAKEIKQIIENIVALSNNTVEISNRVNDVISKEQTDIRTAQDKFILLSDSVEASIKEIDTIKEMAVKLDEIKKELTSSTTELGAVSEELGAAAEEVAANCQMVSDACVDTQSSTEDMRSINDSMSTAIDYFKL